MRTSSVRISLFKDFLRLLSQHRPNQPFMTHASQPRRSNNYQTPWWEPSFQTRYPTPRMSFLWFLARASTPKQDKARPIRQKEPQFALHICLIRVNHVGDGHRHDTPQGSLRGCRKRDTLRSYARSARLGDDDETDRAYRKVVEEVPDQHERGLSPDDARWPPWNAVQDADNEL